MATNSILMRTQISQREPLLGAYIWLMLFMVVYCARPQEWIPEIGAILPLGKVTGVLAFLALSFAIGKIRQRLPRAVIYLTLLIGQLWLTVPMSSVWRGGAFDSVLEFSKILPIVIVITLAVRTARRLRRLLLLQCVSVAIIATYAVIRGGHTAAGRLGLEGVVGGNYANPNDLAFSVVLTLPICLVLLFTTRNMLLKVFFLVAMPAMIYTVLQTGSRGGLICFMVATAASLWEFSIRGRRRYLLVIVPLATIIFLALAGGSVSRRFQSTFQNTDQFAYTSAQERWNLLVTSLEVTAEHPLFGVGPGNFNVVSGHWRVTHNSFTQMSSEGGLPAFVMFVLILRCAFRNVKSTRQLARDEGTTLLTGAFHASLLAYVVGSFFDAVSYQLFTYFLVAYTTVLYQMTLRQQESTVQPSAAPIKEEIGKNLAVARADHQRNAHHSAAFPSSDHPIGRFGQGART